MHLCSVLSYDRMIPDQRRAKNRRDTGARERLIDAAQQCIRARGLAATSSRAITELADTNLASITYYFGTKEHLVAAALARELNEWLQPALDQLKEPGDPALRLLLAVETLSATFEAQRSQAAATLDVFAYAARDPSGQSPVAKAWIDLRAQLGAVVIELRDGGTVPAWVDAEAMAALIMAVAGGTVLGAAVEPAATNHREIAAEFTKLLLAVANPRAGDS